MSITYDYEVIKQFNKQSHEFLTKMALSFPEEPKIKTYKYMFENIKQVNPRSPVEIFMENLRLFGVQIMSRDENFFKKDQYINNAESLSGKLGLVERWNTVPIETKNSIWDYMQVLYVLGMKSLGLKEELAEILSQIS